MDEFVEQCRNEWRRLGVADSVSEEMAEELTSDLREASAEGASPEDVVGSGVADPAAFAAAWATERGAVPSGRRRLLPGDRRLLAPVAAAFAAEIGRAHV